MAPIVEELTKPQLPSDEEIKEAFNRGVNTALLEHKRAGVPIVVWEDGKIKQIPAEEIVVPDEPRASRD